MMPLFRNRLVQLAALLVAAGAVYWAGSNAGRQARDATSPDGASAEMNAETSKPVDPRDKAAQQRLAWLEEQTRKMKERSKRSTGVLELPEDEQAYVNEALARKMDARQLLQSELLALLTVVLDRHTTDEELQEAIGGVERVRQQVAERVKEIDADLSQRVPLRARARMLASGMLDNGLGLMSGAATREEGPSMADGPAGGMGPGPRGGMGPGRPPPSQPGSSQKLAAPAERCILIPKGSPPLAGGIASLNRRPAAFIPVGWQSSARVSNGFWVPGGHLDHRRS